MGKLRIYPCRLTIFNRLTFPYELHPGAEGVCTRVQRVSAPGSRGCLHPGPEGVCTRVQRVSAPGSRGCLHPGPEGVYTRVQRVSAPGCSPPRFGRAGSGTPRPRRVKSTFRSKKWVNSSRASRSVSPPISFYASVSIQQPDASHSSILMISLYLQMLYTTVLFPSSQKHAPPFTHARIAMLMPPSPRLLSPRSIPRRCRIPCVA